MRIMIIHGPNLNLLGEREPDVYGNLSLDQINEHLENLAVSLKVQLLFFQSNHEGAIIDFIHQHRKDCNGIVINPGALTHYSYALRDAIKAVNISCIEVHLSDVYSREPFRRVSVIKEHCLQQISGLGLQSYIQGLENLVAHLRN
jgi:3-dehydroquinate dehydratase II